MVYAHHPMKMQLRITPVPLKTPVKIDDYRCRVMGKWVEVEQVLVKRTFSQRA